VKMCRARPLITPQLEGSTSYALRQVVLKAQSIIERGRAQILDISLLQTKSLRDRSAAISEGYGGTVLSACHSYKDYDYIHPVRVACISLLVGRHGNGTNLIVKFRPGCSITEYRLRGDSNKHIKQTRAPDRW